MRVLLTGAAGWLGRHLKPKLVGQGHTVAGLDIAASPDTDIVGTVADRALVALASGEHRFEAVIHAGALHKPDIARFPARAFGEAKVAGTLNLLEEAAAARARFVFTSTTSLMISQPSAWKWTRPPSGSTSAQGRWSPATSTASPSLPPKGCAASTISRTLCPA